MSDLNLHATAHTFYVTKGVVGLLATVLYLIHMNRIWGTLTSWGQRLRYLALLAGGMLLTYASVEQISDDAPVSLRNQLAMAFGLLLLAAAVVSLIESWLESPPKGDTRRGLPHR